jgi:hypothetical protein
LIEIIGLNVSFLIIHEYLLLEAISLKDKAAKVGSKIACLDSADVNDCEASINDVLIEGLNDLTLFLVVLKSVLRVHPFFNVIIYDSNTDLKVLQDGI